MNTELTWIAAALDPAFGGATPQEVDAHVLAVLESAGLDADLVCTHVDRTTLAATVVMSARVHAEVTVEVRHRLATALGVEDAEAVVETHRCPSAERTSRSPAVRAVEDARAGVDGRCVRFPGQSLLVGSHLVAEVVSTSAIDEVVGAGTGVRMDDTVDTHGFLRPVLSAGHMVLMVEAAAGGVLVPVERQRTHECCGGH